MFCCFLPKYVSCYLILHPKPLGFVFKSLVFVFKPLGFVFRLFLLFSWHPLFTLPDATLASELVTSMKDLTETVRIIEMCRSW